jgi:peptidoglycan/xylan/chitin deacetylase (PgdA/CDA1 family)
MKCGVLFLLGASACASPVAYDETASAVTASTIVSLTFDDTLADQVSVGDLVAARGMRATFYVNSSRFDVSGFMTKAQVLALQAQGNEIGGHTIDHANLASLSDAEARWEVCNDRAALLAAGVRATSLAYPFGANSATVDQIADDCGYNSSRDVGGLVTGSACSGCPYANTIPPADLYPLRTNDSIDATTTLATMQGYVTQAEQHGGGYVPMVFHHVCDGCSTDAVSPATLAAFLDWLAARGPSTQVATVDAVIGGPVRPSVTVANQLRNPSLETDANADQVPDCWQRGGFGTNTATYSLASDAFDGSVAQRIAITSFTSGGRRLVSAQDTGACAPAVTPGHAYAITAQYKATTPTRLTIYYRNTSGVWAYFAESPLMPVSSSIYREAIYKTPAMPADATAISAGLGIFAVGTLTMDAYTLIDATTAPPDTAAPGLAIACNGTACATSAYASPVTVTLAAADAASGVREIRYTTNGSDPTTGTLYTAPFTVSATATVRATALDRAGNRATQSASIVIGSPPPPPPGNMLQNASLETDANGDQVPDCWQRGAFGTNTAAFTLTSDAQDGSVAQRIDITSFTSGGRRLVSAQDSGACAPSVIPGHTYTMTAFYKASTPPKFSVYVRGTDGAWRWIAESALLPTSTTYRQGTFTTPALPADATAISIGLSIFNVGSITSDAYTLVDTAGPPPPPPPDTTPPALAIACNGSACTTSPYASPLQITLSASDASGIADLRYTTDGSDPTTGTPYTAPFALTASATVRATAVDTAGNRATQSAAITVQEGPPPPPPPSNLLQNASLEVDADGNQVPDCWKRDGYGTNTATYTLVSGAFDGSVAQRIDITSFTSGGRRLASAQDAGACAPSVTPGTSYTMTAHYIATVSPRFSVYVRGTDGTWRWFAESSNLPAASSYALATYTSPAMPADATAISIGLSIFAAGALTSDAYTLTAAP